jgi:hypothetical protein
VLTHDYFESLCGAIALGEASRPERALFLLHARQCPACAEDVGLRDGELVTLAQDARERERWQPTVRDAVATRVHEGQSRSRRAVVAGLGYAFAASVLLNVVCSLGLPERLVAALVPQPEPLRVIAYVVVRSPRLPSR